MSEVFSLNTSDLYVLLSIVFVILKSIGWILSHTFTEHLTFIVKNLPNSTPHFSLLGTIEIFSFPNVLPIKNFRSHPKLLLNISFHTLLCLLTASFRSSSMLPSLSSPVLWFVWSPFFSFHAFRCLPSPLTQGYVRGHHSRFRNETLPSSTPIKVESEERRQGDDVLLSLWGPVLEGVEWCGAEYKRDLYGQD